MTTWCGQVGPQLGRQLLSGGIVLETHAQARMFHGAWLPILELLLGGHSACATNPPNTWGQSSVGHSRWELICPSANGV
jgi:hypothetical protein